ncbi:MAG: LacI family DNA-binding transcriptional regulator [Phycisphaerales bacterium]|nr:MAG: LacI family DNA-binding transcriptional regulator [Phycisphaerales bacterium]
MAVNPRATLKDIAERLGISVTTVSRILNGRADRYRISDKTAKAVFKVARELNFSPNPLARGLRLNKTQTIGLVIPDISNPFFASIARNVESEARKRGYSVILCDSEESIDLEIESLALLQSRKVEGLVVSPVGTADSHLRKFESANLPIVIVDRHFPDVSLPFVASDNFGGALEGVNHLVENGHRNIACIQGLRCTMPNNERVRGYRAALENHNIPFDESLIVGNSFGEENGYIESKLLLKKRRDVTAVLALSNLISLGVLRALGEEGLRVPDDISIVSFDEQPYSAYLATPMSTVGQNSVEMGQIAVKLLFSQIESPHLSHKEGILLPTTLIKRESVKKLG